MRVQLIAQTDRVAYPELSPRPLAFPDIEHRSAIRALECATGNWHFVAGARLASCSPLGHYPMALLVDPDPPGRTVVARP